MNALVDWILRERASVMHELVDYACRNPFWLARYGEAGRRVVLTEGQYHLMYLTEALAARDPQMLVTYARWLRRVLTLRGVCTLQLTEMFARLATIISAEADISAEDAVVYLAQCEAALRYPHGHARDLQRNRERSAERALRCLAPKSHWVILPAPVQRLLAPRYLIDYLADAQAFATPAIFDDHITWLTHHLRTTCPAGAEVLSRLVEGIRDVTRTAQGSTAEQELQRMPV